MKLSPKQAELLGLIKDGGNIIHSVSPGKEFESGNYFLEKKNDHRDLDGRTVVALEKRGLIKCWGSAGQWSTGFNITEAGRDALGPL